MYSSLCITDITTHISSELKGGLSSMLPLFRYAAISEASTDG